MLYVNIKNSKQKLWPSGLKPVLPPPPQKKINNRRLQTFLLFFLHIQSTSYYTTLE
jgi:hypothetical protein